MSSRADRLRPVVAVDIDGVLRLGVRPNGPTPEGAYPVELTTRADAYPTFFHRSPTWDEDGTQTNTHWLSGIGADWIRSLLGRGIDVVWATTWQEYANVYFAEPLGIPPLPLGVSGGGDEGEFPDSPEWKSVTLAQRFPGRPLVWVDDNPVSDNRLDLPEIRAPRDRALTWSFWVTNSERGITRDDVTHLDAWLALASTPEGHDTLRRRRRNERRRTQRTQARYAHGTLARAAKWERAYKLAEALLEEPDRSLAALIAGSVRDDTFDRDHLRDLVERWKRAPLTPQFNALLDAIEDHIRNEKQRQPKGRQ